MPKKNIQKTKSIKKDSGIKSAREKMIGQHIGYRYDVNLLPDYKKLTPFLKKYIEHMGWDDLNWLEDVHMGYENGKPAVFDRNINGWVTTPPKSCVRITTRISSILLRAVRIVHSVK